MNMAKITFFTCCEKFSRKILGTDCADHQCAAPSGKEGHLCSKTMTNLGFIGIHDIQNIPRPTGFSNFKIEGRALGSAMFLEFVLYFMMNPEYRDQPRQRRPAVLPGGWFLFCFECLKDLYQNLIKSSFL